LGCTRNGKDYKFDMTNVFHFILFLFYLFLRKNNRSNNLLMWEPFFLLKLIFFVSQIVTTFPKYFGVFSIYKSHFPCCSQNSRLQHLNNCLIYLYFWNASDYSTLPHTTIYHFCIPISHSLTHSLTPSLTHSLSHSILHSFIYSFIYLFIHLFIHIFIQSLIHSPTHPSIHQCIYVCHAPA